MTENVKSALRVIEILKVFAAERTSLSQHALIVLPRLAYHDYEGIALNHDERERLVADIGEKKMMLLRNHGTLAVGETAAECWINMFYLERACKQQVMALSAGRENVLLAPQAAQDGKAADKT